MAYLILFVFELMLLWFLSRAVNTRFFRLLPMPLYVLLFLPGTFLHELSHFLMAKALFVRVGRFSLKPERREKEIVLGSVAIGETSIAKRILIGAAPVIFGLAIILSIIYLVVSKNLANDFLVIAFLGYLIFVIANNMYSSKKDLEGAWKLGLIVAILAAALHFLGVRISVDINEQVFRLGCLYLLIPIGIDAGILWALSLSRR